MSGGYVRCGKWLGEDKSCSAFLPLLEQLEALVTEEERGEWESIFAEPLREQLDETPEEDLPHLRLSPRMIEVLARLARRYVDREVARGVEAEPDDDDDGSRSGPGWRLYCASNLVQAHEQSVKIGKEVVIHYD